MPLALYHAITDEQRRRERYNDGELVMADRESSPQQPPDRGHPEPGQAEPLETAGPCAHVTDRPGGDAFARGPIDREVQHGRVVKRMRPVPQVLVRTRQLA